MKEKLLLEKCLEILDEIMDFSVSEVYGTPPESFIIELGAADVKLAGFLIKEVKATYLYKNKELTIIENGTKAVTEPSNGMYYHQGYAKLGISPKNGMGYIDYIVGKRYGRGLRYEFVEDESGLHIDNEEGLWIS